MALRFGGSLALLALSLAGCTPLRGLVPQSTLAPSATPVPVPDGSLRATVRKTGQVHVFTLRDRRDAVATWRSADGTLVSFRDGVLIETRGFGADLMSSDMPKAAQLQSPQASHTRRYFFVDRNDQIGRAEMRCTTERGASGEIRETCRDSQRSLQNTYRFQGPQPQFSREWVSPFLGYIEFEGITRE